MDSTFNNPNQMPPIQGQMDRMDKKSKGPLIAVIIILALIIVGGLYFLKERAAQDNQIPTITSGDSITASLNQQNSSDELNAIEADLNAVDLNNLDQGAAVIEAELQ